MLRIGAQAVCATCDGTTFFVYQSQVTDRPGIILLCSNCGNSGATIRQQDTESAPGE